MMGARQESQDSLFYQFNLENHVPDNHLLTAIDMFVDLDFVREHLRSS